MRATYRDRIEARIVRDSGPEVARVSGSRTAAAIARALIGDQAQEVGLVLFLSARNEVIGHGIAGTGGMTQCVVEASAVYRLALLSPCAGIVFAHNHPSGDITPSSDDVVLTRRLAEAGAVVGIPLLDSIVVTDGPSFYSFAEHGLLSEAR